MKPRSAKAKGRALQNHIRDLILKYNKSLTVNDVKPAIMGETGMDIKLSEAARKIFPFATECRNKAAFAVYSDFSDAVAHAKDTELNPVLFIKQNRERPLAVLDAEFFINMVEICLKEQW